MLRCAMWVLSCLFPLWLTLAAWPATADVIVYPRPESADDARTDYPLKLLRLAFDKAGAHHELRPTAVPMQQGRALTQLARGESVRVVWSMTSIEREAQLLPIRIPIYKGLIGWRLPLVPSDQPDLLKTVHSLTELRQFTAGQGHDWPDTAILRGNGLKVVGVPQYESLFRMLAMKRFDYFPRSIAEIWAEAESHQDDGVVIDQHVVLRYTAAFYFFVNKNDRALGEIIRIGLERAIQDGSFDRLFCQTHLPFIEQAELERRNLIELRNPVLPPDTPLGRKELWFSPDQCKTETADRAKPARGAAGKS